MVQRSCKLVEKRGRLKLKMVSPKVKNSHSSNRRVEFSFFGSLSIFLRSKKTSGIFTRGLYTFLLKLDSQLMLEVSHTSHYHAHSMSVAIVYAILVFDGPSRLDNSGNSFFIGDLYTIREGEKGV